MDYQKTELQQIALGGFVKPIFNIMTLILIVLTVGCLAYCFILSAKLKGIYDRLENHRILIDQQDNHHLKDFKRLNQEILDLHKKDSNLQLQIDKPNPYTIGKSYKHGKYTGYLIKECSGFPAVSVKRIHSFEKNNETVKVEESLMLRSDNFSKACSKYFQDR